jgi:hypothetical protein
MLASHSPPKMIDQVRTAVAKMPRQQSSTRLMRVDLRRGMGTIQF